MKYVGVCFSLLLCGLLSCADSGALPVKSEEAMQVTERPDFYIQGTPDQLEAYRFDGKTIRLSEEEWKRILSPQAYHILREKGTERAFTGSLNKEYSKGIFQCAACGMPLFTSDSKFDSGSGWPSFFQPIAHKGEPPRIKEVTDYSYGMVRTEILCARCGSHLGHVFPDGPRPTGLRYCVNSASLGFSKKM
jgi:peptide-methionine (R)-S-oxide reductase